MESKFTATLSADLFRRVALAQSYEETRYYLCGVYVQPCEKHGGAILTATDGHILITAHDASAIIGDGTRESAGAIVGLPKELLRACKPGALLRIHDNVATVDTPRGATLSARDVIVDGSFPDWRRVIPAVTETPSHSTYDARLVARMAEALTEGDKGNRLLTLNADSPASPALAFGTLENAFGVIMPVFAGPPAELPAWLAA